MFPATEARIAVAYLLVMKIAVRAWLTGGSVSGKTTLSERLLTGRTVTAAGVLAQLLYLLPIITYVVAPEFLLQGQLDVPTAVSWVATGLAATVVVVFGWAWRSVTAAFDGDTLSLKRLATTPGPFRSMRYPYEAANVAFQVFLSVATSNWWVVGCTLVASFLVRCAVIPRLERDRSSHWREDYVAYTKATGVFLPKIGDGGERQYTVPRRFGMAAIIALFTTLGILFGVLRYWEASPVIYLFVTSEIVAICLAQIVFGSAPRSVSIVLGAVLLPFWVYLELKIKGQSRPPYIEPFWVYALFSFLFAFGGLLGYCIGALAAGFFLVMDLIETAWEGPAPVPPAPLPDGYSADIPKANPLADRRIRARQK